MLICKLELVPLGVGNPRTIIEIEIENDGTGTEEIGNYDISSIQYKRNKQIKTNIGRVENYKRDKPVICLLDEAIKTLFPELKTEQIDTLKFEAADLNKCPNCGGIADQGHDRCDPPNSYYCTKCDALISSGYYNDD